MPDHETPPGRPWQDVQRDHVFFTWSAQRGQAGMEIDDAKGARFHVPGKGWVYDLESQVYNVNIGHRNPHVVDRMKAQLETLPAAGPNVVLPIRAELGALLHEKSGLKKAFLTAGGAEAVENAIKMARLVTGRTKVVARRNSYHGATLQTLTVAGDPRREPFAKGLGPAYHVDDPYPPRAPAGETPSDWVENLEAVVESEGPETIAAILLEGFTGTNGMQVPPEDFWPRARALCDAHGILLIDDEIFSGFGRTGTWFAREHWGVEVDMMVVGKGLASGYAPLAGVLAGDRVATHFEDETLWCGLTTYAHPVACAAAVGSIEVLDREGMVESAARVGAHLQGRLKALAKESSLAPHIRDVRGLGLMQCLQLDRSADDYRRALWEADLYAPGRGDLVFLCPPLCLTVGEADEIVDRMARTLRGLV